MEVFIGLVLAGLFMGALYGLGYALKIYPFYPLGEAIDYRPEILEAVVKITKTYEPSRTGLRSQSMFNPALKIATVQMVPYTISEKFLVTFHLPNSPEILQIDHRHIYETLTQPTVNLGYQKGYNSKSEYVSVKIVFVEIDSQKLAVPN